MPPCGTGGGLGITPPWQTRDCLGGRRRRVKTVIQEIMTLAAHCVRHARRQILSFPVHTLAFAPFQRLYAVWSAPCHPVWFPHSRLFRTPPLIGGGRLPSR